MDLTIILSYSGSLASSVLVLIFYAYLGSTLDRLAYLRDYTATNSDGPGSSINLRYDSKILPYLFLQSFDHSPTSQVRDPHFRIVILRAANLWSTFSNCCV